MMTTLVVMGLFAAATLPWVTREGGGKHQLQVRVRPAEVDLAVAADLIKAGLRAGSSLTDSLRALGRVSGTPELEVFAKALVLGVPWEVASRELPSHWGDLLAVLEPVWKSGVAAENLLADFAGKLRLERSQASRQAAAQLATRLVLPLTLCLLPAFVMLGIVPVLWVNLSSFWN